MKKVLTIATAIIMVMSMKNLKLPFWQRQV